MVNAKNIVVLITVGLAWISTPAAADSLDGDRFSLSLGVFITDRNTDAELDGSINDGTNINFETDLGIDSSDTVFRVDGYYRFSERHRFDFSVFDLSRSASKQIVKDIQWGDTLFAIDTVVKTDNALSVYKAAYTYSFLNGEDGYLGATFGLYVADSKMRLEEENLGSAEIGQLTAPLPVIGLRGEYALSDRWSFRASGEFFFIEYENVDGSLVDFYAGIDYQVLDNLSVGLGVNSVNINVDATDSTFNGALDWRYSGALVFLKFNF